jgi:hypothetical protein
MAVLREVVVGGDARGWERAGFDVRDRRIRLAGVTLRIDPDAERPVPAWGLAGLPGDAPGDLDGIRSVDVPATSDGDGEVPGDVEAPAHPNGITALDHVVVLTRDLTVTGAAFAAAGLEARRTRDVPGSEPPQRQVFYVLGTAVAEVVGPVDGSDAAGTARLWGLAFVAPDLDDTVAALGRLAGPARGAVQPGRRIATLHHRSARIPVPTVILSPRP